MHHVELALDIADRVTIRGALRNRSVTDNTLSTGAIDAVDADTQQVAHDLRNQTSVEIPWA